MEELSDILRRLEPSLGPLSGEPRAARRRHHQPQLPRDARGRRLRDPPAGQGHRSAGHRPARPSGWQQKRPRGWASLRRWRRRSRTASSRASSSAGRCSASDLLDGRRADRARPAQLPRLADASCRRASASRTCSRTTRRSSAGAAARCRAPTPRRSSPPRGSPPRCPSPSPARVTTICSRGTSFASPDDGSLRIVDWEYAGMGDPRFDLGNLSINNGFDEATMSAC